jgi:Signal transduction histidine kinase involved in nitrogen fixation and metabolism regulation
MRHTVRVFIITLVTASVAVGFALLALAESRALWNRLLADKQAELTRVVTILAESAERKFEPDLLLDEFKAWGAIAGGLDEYRLSLISRDGRLLDDSQLPPDQLNEAADSRHSRPEVAQALASGLGVSQRYSATEGRDYLYVAARVTFRSELKAPPMVIRLGAPVNMIKEVRSDLLKSYALSASFLTLLALAVSTLTTRPLERGIKELIAASQDLAGGNLSRRIVRHPTNELAFVGVALNRLASRFSRQEKREKEDQERLLAILENMAEGVMVTDSDGRITNSNPALARLFLLEGPLTGFPGQYVRAPEFIEALGRAARGEILPPLTVALPGGYPPRTAEVRLRPLGDEYEPDGVVAVFHEIPFPGSRR